MMQSLSEHTQKDSTVVCQFLASVYDCEIEKIFLAPGILMALRLLVQTLGVQKILLSSIEYYSSVHFPNCTVSIVPIDKIEDTIFVWKPDLVLISNVSWKGEINPISQIFERTKKKLGGSSPILCADLSHAGAIGFPSIKSVNADVIFGDASKWITPINWPDRLAFISPVSSRIEEQLCIAYSGLYLAHPEIDNGELMEARWVDPFVIHELSVFIKSKELNREELLRWHSANNDMATQILQLAGYHKSADSCIIWFEDGLPENVAESGVVKPEHSWQFPDGGMRVLCQVYPKEDY